MQLKSWLFSILLISLAAQATPLRCDMIHHRTNFAENQAKKIIQEARYVKHRSFYEYSRAFGSEFTTELESLSLEAVWIDMGAGVGRALKDSSEFRNRFGKSHPQLWGVSKQDADFDTKEFSVRWLGGRYFEEIKANEFPASLHLVTDYFGVLSYTAHVSEYLNFVFDRMPIQGKFFAVIGSGDRILKSDSHWHRIFGNLTLLQYLKSVPNLQVKTKSLGDGSQAVIMIKTGPVLFPQLYLKKYDFQLFPQRQFIM